MPLHLCISPRPAVAFGPQPARILQRSARARVRARVCKLRASRLVSRAPPLRACAEPDPDADLASAWFDDDDVSV
eukprot:CAMPEP_0183363758 /NCGR_PEP_ID=MMETSP0164_2-20130417/76672_1 /TAXON_ID=221442 /ORGANISM="Coccolithus pelagicus ssp braarudi, Strain PLY182g" /LENGTH=74 /DNA_ID=CAMNT_0025538923 /DNA_START=114 /DNA_END=335 /DNA_ORIENTATION=-